MHASIKWRRYLAALLLVAPAAHAESKAPPPAAKSATKPVAPSAISSKPFTSDQCNENLPMARDTYIVQFDQAAGRFIYPPHPAFDNDEIVLRICNTSTWKRYRLVFGSKTVGDDAITSTTVGYTATELDAALRGANVILANDHTCSDPALLAPAAPEPATGVKPAPAKAPPDFPGQCVRLRKEVSALVEVAKLVMDRRDFLASTIAECGSLPALDPDPDPEPPASGDGFDTRCAALLSNAHAGHKPGADNTAAAESYDIGYDTNWYLKDRGISDEIVWIDDAWHVVDRGEGSLPSIASNPGEGTLPAALIGYLNTRSALITSIQQAMDGYSKLAALSLQMREDLARRQTVFRIGRFPGNRIVVATLEEHTVRVGFTQDRKHLRFGTEVVPHQLSMDVEKTSFVQFDFGIALSSADEPRYKSEVTVAGSVPTATVSKDSDGHDLNPVLFASFLWCSQDLGRPWINRTCRDGSKGIAWWAPRIAVGLPLSANLGRGSVYAGLALPYIPYVSLIGGLNAQRADRLNGIAEGDAVPASGIPTTATLKLGFFGSIGVTEEIFNLLIPRMEAAK